MLISISDNSRLVAAYFNAVIALIRKDALLELRAKESISAMVLFAIMSLVMLNFGLRLRASGMRELAPSVLWIAIVFAGTLGLGRNVAGEHVTGAFDALVMAPHDPSYIFVAKACTNALHMLITGLLCLPLAAIFFDERLLNGGVVLVLIVGTLGYAGAGTLTAVLAMNTRARDVLLPILLFPLVLPLVVACVLATAGYVDRLPFADFGSWLGVGIGFAVIFWTAGVLLFEYVVE